MILITGANGLLGSFLANTLAVQGNQVLAFVRENADLSLLDHKNENIQLFFGDVLDIESLRKAFNDLPISKVVHSAAIVSYQPGDYEKMHVVNIEGTKNIVNISLQYSLDKFVFISSVAALGRSSSGIVDEETAWNNTGYNSKYGISKREAELEVWRGQIEGLNTVILNPSLILAPADGKRSSSRLFSFLKLEKSFYPTGTLNYIDIRDAVDIIIEFLYNEINNDRYILNAGTVPYKDFFIQAANIKGLNPPKYPVKKITGILALFADKLRSKIGNKESMLSAESLRVSRSNVRFDNSKIKRKLNFKFRSLDESIEWVWQQLNLQEGVEK